MAWGTLRDSRGQRGLSPERTHSPPLPPPPAPPAGWSAPRSAEVRGTQRNRLARLETPPGRTLPPWAYLPGVTHCSFPRPQPPKVPRPPAEGPGMVGWYQAPPPPWPTCGSGTWPSSSRKPLPTLVFPRAPLAPGGRGRGGAVCRQVPAHPPESSFFLEAIVLSLGSRDRHSSAVTCDAVAVPCSPRGSEDGTRLQGAGQVFQDAERRRGRRGWWRREPAVLGSAGEELSASARRGTACAAPPRPLPAAGVLLKPAVGGPPSEHPPQVLTGLSVLRTEDAAHALSRDSLQGAPGHARGLGRRRPLSSGLAGAPYPPTHQQLPGCGALRFPGLKNHAQEGRSDSAIYCPRALLPPRPGLG